MRALLVTLLAGCGRLGFDELAQPPACDPIGHDEDADGFDDACDVCPQLVDPMQADGDGDRVGDICDPHPDEARDQLVLFDPFLGERPEWMYSGPQPTFAGDALIVDTRPLGDQFRADLLGAPGEDTYSVIMSLGAGRAGQRQVALYALDGRDAVEQLYFCDLDNNVNGDFWVINSTLDNTDFSPISPIVNGTPIENGRVSMTMKHTPAAVTCATSWPVDVAEITGPLPVVGIDPDRVSISVLGLEVAFESFTHIRSN